jgi:membrane associated rhomboid family serine protease
MVPRLAHRLAVLAALVLAAVAVVALDRPRGSWGERLRRRFLAGVPWGTLVSAGLVLAVYLFVQGGWSHWYAPVTIPFRAWSYFYPLGVVTAGFAHVGVGHLLGNLAGTLALAPLAEYAWGHFPGERGSYSFGSARTNPYVRAFLLFPGAVVAVGLLTAAFGIGPVIGFSGVVFAFAGFALVFYPVPTVLALVASDALRLAYLSVRTPVVEASSSPGYGAPWWAQIAVQAHALGLLLGVVLALGLLRRRGGAGRSGVRLWVGGALVAVSEALWAVYWFRGGETFVLYRAVGLALVALLATLVAVAGSASDRPLLDRIPDAVPARVRPRLAPLRAVPRWQSAAALLLVATAAVAGPAVPVNLLAASEEPVPGPSTEVRDYEVTYAENVTSGMVSVIDIELFGETTRVDTAGVIVRSESRNIWLTAVSKGELAFFGRQTVLLGGIGWRSLVVANRTGWVPVGGEPVYRVRLRNGGESFVAFRSAPSTAAPVVAGRNVTVAAVGDGFRLRVSRNNTTLGTTPLPANGSAATVGGLRLVRRSGAVYAVRNDTRVRVVRKERYRGQA